MNEMAQRRLDCLYRMKAENAKEWYVWKKLGCWRMVEYCKNAHETLEDAESEIIMSGEVHSAPLSNYKFTGASREERQELGL